MASAAVARDGGEPPRKRLKLPDLPLAANQRTAINTILHAYKKRGSFDSLRKSVWSSFEASLSKSTLAEDITTLAENEIERNPTLLAKDRRLAAPLIEGAAERSGVYSKVESDVEDLIESLLGDAGSELRELRRKDVGDAAAAEEERKGAKTDEEYAEDAVVRRQRRAKQREDEIRRARQKELEALRKREQELVKQREERDRVAKEKEEARQKALATENAKREAEMKERTERKARQDAQWAAEQREREEKARKEREKNIKEAALEELLWEGKKAAAKSSGAIASPLRSSSSGKRESAIDEIMRREKLERGEKIANLERVDSTTSRRLIKRRTESDAKPVNSTSLQPGASMRSPGPTQPSPSARSTGSRPPATPGDATTSGGYDDSPKQQHQHGRHAEQHTNPSTQYNSANKPDVRRESRSREMSAILEAASLRRSSNYGPATTSRHASENFQDDDLRRDHCARLDHNSEIRQSYDRKRSHDDFAERVDHGARRRPSIAPPPSLAPKSSQRDDGHRSLTLSRSYHDEYDRSRTHHQSLQEEDHVRPTNGRSSHRDFSPAPPTHPRSQRNERPFAAPTNLRPYHDDTHVSTSARSHRDELHNSPVHDRSHHDSGAQSPAHSHHSPVNRSHDKNSTPAEIDRYVPSTSARAARPNDSVRTKIVDRAAEDDRGHPRRRSRTRDRDRSWERIDEGAAATRGAEVGVGTGIESAKEDIVIVREIMIGSGTGIVIENGGETGHEVEMRDGGGHGVEVG
ncbi:MAG: hypothetical protein Q9162_003183 [Coniocarpon cinnabarinum]